MNKKKKKRTAGVWKGLLAFAAVILGSCLVYLYVYRTNTEPPAELGFTNRKAALYTLEEQMEVLSAFDGLTCFAFEGREEEKDYGTYVIPGLKSTKTILTESGTQEAICTSMTPQGLAVTEEYILISAYCHTYTHNSVIYVIDRETHSLVKEVVLQGQPHVGGLAYDSVHGILWYSSNTNGIAQAVSITMEDLEAYSFSGTHRPIRTTQVCSLYGIVRDSFMTFYDGCLYVGCFNKFTESVIACYEVDEEGRLVNTLDEALGMSFEMALPLEYSTISQQVQGMAFYEDQLLLSQSFGPLPQRLPCMNSQIPDCILMKTPPGSMQCRSGWSRSWWTGMTCMCCLSPLPTPIAPPP